MSGTAEGAGATATSLIVWLVAVKNGVFGTLYTMQKKDRGSGTIAIAGELITWLQFMAFLFTSKLFIWRDGTVAPIEVLSLIPSPEGWYKVLDAGGFFALYFISYVWVLLFAGLMLWALRTFLRGDIPELWPLRTLSKIGTVSATVAYIPVLAILLSPFRCGPDLPFWEQGYTCFEGGHLVLLVISCTLALVFTGLSVLWAVIVFDPHPLTPNLAGKVHGRVDAFVILVKTILVLTVTIFASYIDNAWVFTALNIAAALGWLLSVFLYLPYSHNSMNALQLALSTWYLFGGVCLVISQAAPHVDAAIIFYVGSPTALLFGARLLSVRHAQLVSIPLSKMTSPFEVELRARTILQDSLQGVLNAAMELAKQMEAEAPSGPSVRESLRGGSSDQGDIEDDDAGSLPDFGGSDDGPPGSEPRDLPSVSRDSHSQRDGQSQGGGMRKSSDGKSRASGLDDMLNETGLLAASYAAMDTEARGALVREKLPTSVIAEVESLFRSAVLRYPGSALLHVCQALFYSIFKADRHLNISHLLLANRLSPALDVDFMAFQARRTAENSGSGGGVLSSAMLRISFDKHLDDARRSTLKAAQLQVAFWQELTDPKPDINLLHSVSTDLAKHTQLADEHFQEVFALHPQSLTAMRLFAQFNLSVVNNSERAAALSQEADRIEDQRDKEQGSGNVTGSQLGSQFPFFDEFNNEVMQDSGAVLTIGASARDLGMILQANAGACKLLGYTRLQLERRNVSILVPPPFSDAHLSYMRRYIQTGEGKILETTIVVMAKHRQGHLIPVLALVRESSLPDGTQVFTATLRMMNYSDHVVMLDSSYVVLGGTAGALLGLSVEPATLALSEVNMGDYCPALLDPKAVDDLMSADVGDIINIRLPGHAELDQDASATGGNQYDRAEQKQQPKKLTSPMKGPKGSGMDLTEVMATLVTMSKRGHTIHFLSWRALTTAEITFNQNKKDKAEAKKKAKKAGINPKAAGISRGVSFRDDNSPAGSIGTGGGSDDGSGGGSGGGSDDGSGGGSGVDSDSAAGEAWGSDAGLSQEGDEMDDVDDQEAGSIDLGATQGTGKGDNFMAGGRKALTGSALAAAMAGATCPVVGPRSAGMMSPHGSKTVGAPPRRGSKSKSPRNDGDFSTNNPMHTRKSQSGGLPAHGRRGSHSSRPDRRGHDEIESVGNNDEKSVGQSSSGSSSKKSGVSRATMTKLRRSLVSLDGKHALAHLPGLQSLYITGWILFMLNFALAAMSAALLDGNFFRYGENLKFTAIAGRTSELHVKAMRLLSERGLFNRGWLSHNASFEAKKSAEMFAVAHDYTYQIQEMYDLTAGTPRQSFFTSPTCEFVDFTDIVPEPVGRVTNAAMRAMLTGTVYWPTSLSDGSVLVGRRRMTSLLDFSTQWAGVLKQVSEMSVSNVTVDNQLVRFLTTNTQAGAPAHMKIRSSVFEAFLASKDTEEGVKSLTLWIFVAMGPALATVILAFVIPILLYIDRSRDDIMERFLDLPNLVTATLLAQAERRLKQMRQEDNDDEDDEDEDDDMEWARKGENQYHADDESQDDQDVTDWESVFQRAAVDASRESKKMGRHDTSVSMDGEYSRSGSAAPRNRKRPAGGNGGCCGGRSGPMVYPNRGCCTRGVRAQGGGYWRSVINRDGTVSSFIRRDFRKSYNSLLSLSAFLLPVAFMFLFYLILYLVTMDTLVKVINMSGSTSTASVRAASLGDAVESLHYSIASPGYPPEEAFRYDWTNQELANFRDLNQLLVYNKRIDVVPWQENGVSPSHHFQAPTGMESSTVPGVDSNRMALIQGAIMNNACTFITSQPESTVSPAECAVWNGGVFTAGMHSGTRDVVARFRRVRERRWHSIVLPNTTDGTGRVQMVSDKDWLTDTEGVAVPATATGITSSPAGGAYLQSSPADDTRLAALVSLTNLTDDDTMKWFEPYDLKQELASDDFKIMDATVARLLAPAFMTIAEWYSLSGESTVATYRTFLTTYVASFLALFSVGIVLYYLPSINVLGRDIQCKRAMLLLLPTQVTAKVPSLRQLVLQIVAEHEGGGNQMTRAGPQYEDFDEAPAAAAE